MWPKLAFIGLVIVRLMVSGNPDAKRLYDDLLSSYNKLVRPVVNTSDVLRVSIKLKLSQLIDVVCTILNNMILNTYMKYFINHWRRRCCLRDVFILYRIILCIMPSLQILIFQTRVACNNIKPLYFTNLHKGN